MDAEAVDAEAVDAEAVDAEAVGGGHAAAPSFTPAELPAVMLKPSISGCSGFSDASLVRLEVRLGCSSTAKVNRVPSRRVTSMGTISSAKLPASIPATARIWERNAHASISSRVMPASIAA